MGFPQLPSVIKFQPLNTSLTYSDSFDGSKATYIEFMGSKPVVSFWHQRPTQWIKKEKRFWLVIFSFPGRVAKWRRPKAFVEVTCAVNGCENVGFLKAVLNEGPITRFSNKNKTRTSKRVMGQPYKFLMSMFKLCKSCSQRGPYTPTFQQERNEEQQARNCATIQILEPSSKGNSMIGFLRND